MADQHNLPVVSDLTADRINYIRPEEINYDIYTNKYLHLTSDPNTARRNMSTILYDSKSRADDLFWAAAVKLYEEKVRFLPKNEADIYIDTCLIMHVWHGHALSKVGGNRLQKELMSGAQPLAFVHALITSLLFGWKTTKTRKWFRDWEQKFLPFQSMPHMVEGISELRNHPEPNAGKKFGAARGRTAILKAKARGIPFRRNKRIGAEALRDSARHELIEVCYQDDDQDYVDSDPSPRMVTQRARVPGFFDERELTFDIDVPVNADTYELNREVQSGAQQSFTSGDQTADTIVMEEDTVTVVPRKKAIAPQIIAASYTSRPSEGQVTPAEAKLLHEMASKELLEVDQKLKRVTKEIAQYERQVEQLRQELSSLSDEYGKVKTRVVHWEVAEMGSV